MSPLPTSRFWRLMALTISLLFTLAVAAQDATTPAPGLLTAPRVSGDGSRIYLAADGPNVDFNNAVWVYDVETDSIAALGLLPASATGVERFDPAYLYLTPNDISADGSIMSFLSREPAFAPAWGGDPLGSFNDVVYRYAVDGGTLTGLAAGPERTPADSFYPYETWTAASRLSEDGRYVAYILQPLGGNPEAYLYDAETGETRVLSLDVDGQPFGEALTWRIDLDGGRAAVYEVSPLPLDGTGPHWVYKADLETGEIRQIISLDADNQPENWRLAPYESLSSDGCCTLLVAPPNEDQRLAIHVDDTEGGQVLPLLDGVTFDVDMTAALIEPLDISADGQFVLLYAFTMGMNRLYLLDRAAGEVTFIAEAIRASMSDDAGLVAFQVMAGASIDAPASPTSIYLFRRATGEIVPLISE